ncbi:MAG: hypothetical protein HPY55_05675 [Firmicutes bacterium]|nr:hypothetical protein [Bacillota bacterium]
MRAISAVVIFLVTYAGIASERVPRHIVALLGAVLLVTTGVMNLDRAVQFVSWDTIGLLLGMFILIGVLADSGFFGYMAARVARGLRYNPRLVMIVFPILAAFLSAFMDSITVTLFLVALSLDLTRILGVDPVPLTVAEICAANIGGSATLVGDPPNVILGTLLGYGFSDFLINTGAIALGCLVLTVGYFLAVTWKEYRSFSPDEIANLKSGFESFEQDNTIGSRRLVGLGLAGLAAAIVLLITHGYIDARFHAGISPAIASLLPALIVLVIGGDEARDVFRKIDGENLLFFISLFMVIGGLQETGVVSSIASAVGVVSQGHPRGLIVALNWVSGIASGVVDNVPLALAMGYVAKDLAAGHFATRLALMTWAIALGVDIGGNLTPVGASANVVGYTSLEQRGVKVGWIRWMYYAVPPTLLSLGLSTLVLVLRCRAG